MHQQKLSGKSWLKIYSSRVRLQHPPPPPWSRKLDWIHEEKISIFFSLRKSTEKNLVAGKVRLLAPKPTHLVLCFDVCMKQFQSQLKYNNRKRNNPFNSLRKGMVNTIQIFAKHIRKFMVYLEAAKIKLPGSDSIDWVSNWVHYYLCAYVNMLTVTFIPWYWSPKESQLPENEVDILELFTK